MLPPGGLEPEREIGCPPLRGEPPAECGIARGIIHAQPGMRGDGEATGQGRQPVGRLGGGGGAAALLPLQRLRHEQGIDAARGLAAILAQRDRKAAGGLGPGIEDEAGCQPVLLEIVIIMGNQLAGRQIHGEAGGRVPPAKRAADLDAGPSLGITAIMAGTQLQPGGEGRTAGKTDLPGGLHPGPEAGDGGIGSGQRMGLLGAGP